jgi:hypothetical protein
LNQDEETGTKTIYMHRKGQVLLIGGVLLIVFSMLMTTGYFPNWKWIYITSDIFLLAATVLVIWGGGAGGAVKIKKKINIEK